jgi:hypothetical protein
MKELLFYIEELTKKEIDTKINNEDVGFTSKIISGENIQNLNILQNKDISFLFFDTETSGLISNKSGSVVSSQKSNPQWNSKKKKLLKELFIKYNIPKQDQDDVIIDVKKYVASLQAGNKGTEVNLKQLLPELYADDKSEENESEEKEDIESLGVHIPKYKKIAQEYYDEFLKNKLQGEVDLIEFYGALYGISYDNSNDNIQHQFFSPTEELTDEIKNLIHWSKEKEIKALNGTFEDKAKFIVNLFKKGIKSEKFIIAGHNILRFDIPLLLLYFKRLDQLSHGKTTFFNDIVNILKNKKTYIFDTMNLKKILISIQQKIPNLSLEANKKQVTLQNILGIKNISQHTAAGDVSALIEVFERVMILSVFINNKKYLNSMNTFIAFLEKMKSEGLTKDPIIGYLFKGKYSTLFKALDSNKQQEVEVAISNIRSAVLNIINDIAIIKNKDEKAIDQILINIINNTMKIKKQKKIKPIKEDYVYKEVHDFILLNEAKKKRDKLPGRVRKFAKRMEVKDPSGFLKYFMKRKNEFLDRNYPIGYAIAMAYKISKLKFKVGK